MDNEGFLQRWTRLKSGSQAQSLPPAGRDAAIAEDTGPESAVPDVSAAATAQSRLPTMEDAVRLTPESDYSAFVAQGVDKAVRRVALKRLFSDPHFNLVDGLDIYMGDYNRPDPVSAAMLAALHQAQGFLQQVAAEAEKGAGAGQDKENDQHMLGDASRQNPGDAV
ncbi:DUF3306 domain-containing protein [Janthinobacterium sp. 17J80-10]|uniref:DUF3306 domain-containing protein n=1 Tax=Janthinobacterium sp. 17J80-10 TaxID=2497863 RepID=UPI0010056A5C|nr:DUF3306 domain-containing protein [Janthinobacterium sp. 17J80-10]QAU34968.1 DUF3306 domain-containing protein [Janthinobacterium sp. 17J80-10]